MGTSASLAPARVENRSTSFTAWTMWFGPAAIQGSGGSTDGRTDAATALSASPANATFSLNPGPAIATFGPEFARLGPCATG